MCVCVCVCQKNCNLANYKGFDLSEIVTGSEKTAHFAQYFKIELLVLQDRVALKQYYAVYFLS